jgi:hypothetical protein
MSDKPLPRVNAINRPFWEGCNRGELVLQQCDQPDCGRHIYYPRVCCPYCGGGDLTWRRFRPRPHRHLHYRAPAPARELFSRSAVLRDRGRAR